MEVDATINLTRTTQSILTLEATSSLIAIGGTSDLSTTGGSGSGAVSYSVTAGGSNCSISDTTLTGTAEGTCDVTATKSADSNYNSLASNTITITVDGTPPSAPTLSASKPTLNGNSINLSWNAPATTSTFRLTRIIDGGSETLVNNSIVVATTSQTQSGLSDGSYVYKIYARDSVGNLSTAGTSSTLTIDTTAPAAPSIDASKPTLNGNSINLEWSAPASTDTFRLTRVIDGGSETVVNNSIASSTTTLTQSGLTDGSYVYNIYARDSFGNLSNVGTSSAVVIDTTPPNTPTYFAGDVSGSNINLSWINPVSDFASVTIRKSMSSAPLTISSGNLVAQNLTGTTRADTGLSDGSYYYSIFALDAFGNVSVRESILKVVDTTAPNAPSLSAVRSGTTINLNWNTPSDTHTFRLMRNRNGAGDVLLDGTIGNTTTTYSDTSLTDATYVYKIYSVDDFDNVSTAGISSTITIDSTAPLGPTDFTATVSGTTIHLTWTNPLSDFATVTLRRSTVDYPVSITSPVSVFEEQNFEEYDDENLEDDTYYYSLFATDTYDNVSLATTATATIDTTPEPTGGSGGGGTGGSAGSAEGGGGGEAGTGGSNTTTPVLTYAITPPSSNVPIGSLAVFLMNVDNTSDVDSPETTVTFTLPDNLEFVSAELIESEESALILDDVAFDATLLCVVEDDITCTLGTITAGSQISMHITTTVVEAGSLILGAEFSGTSGAITTTEESGDGTTTGTAVDERSLSGANSLGCTLSPSPSKAKNPFKPLVVFFLTPLILWGVVRISLLEEIQILKNKHIHKKRHRRQP